MKIPEIFINAGWLEPWKFSRGSYPALDIDY
jgi:hypothetical protein